LRVGKVTVGLVGLDVALNRVLGEQCIPADNAVEQVYEEISRQNYIPAAAEEGYRQALRDEILRLRGDGEGAIDGLVIRILGPGCVSCNTLQKTVIEVMAELGVAADVFQVHDLDEIGRFGVTKTPALVINGEVKSAGRMPRRDQVVDWIREAL
jgi:small redox-active disulfide protein 2